MAQTFDTQLDVYLRARFPLIIVPTVEESRAITAIAAYCRRTGRECHTWDLGAGFVTLQGDLRLDGEDPISALNKISAAEPTTQAVFVLKDFHEFWGDARVKRLLRNVAQSLTQTRNSIVVITPSSKLPEELRDEAVHLTLPLPTEDEISDILEELENTPNLQRDLTTTGRQKLVQAAVGLSHSQARRVYSQAIVKDGVLDDGDIDLVTSEKKQIIKESEALEFYSAAETPDNVGGLGVLKHWLSLRERAFSEDARKYGLPAPKGVALIGIPGTGKSLTAKMVASAWHLPLLRLDVGSLFGSLVGESEERTRKAIRVAETIAPCVMWIDELEKSLSQGGNDGGTSQRVLGSILTWMQDKTAPVFVVATANDVQALPPELLRRGRFDEVFFLDLPTKQERIEIFAVHLRKRGRLPGEFEVDRLAELCEGYVGAEIEQAIIDAMYVAFNEGPREFTTNDIADAIERLVPLSRSQRESIRMLRTWLEEGRAQSASFREVSEASSHFVPLEIPGAD